MSDKCDCKPDQGMEMPYYVGVKVVQAAPMTQEQYARHKSLSTYKKNQPGYLVRHTNGYETWIPAKGFKEEYFVMTSKDTAGDCARHCKHFLT